MSKYNAKGNPNSNPEGSVNRRVFAQVALGGVGICYAAAVGYPVFRYLASPVERATSLAAVKEVILKDAQKLAAGTSMMFKFGTRPSMLIHHADDTWTALDAVCTHLGCTVAYEPDKDRIHCACHGGVYNSKTGGNVSGPPPRPLAQYKLEVKATEIVVSRA